MRCHILGFAIFGLALASANAVCAQQPPAPAQEPGLPPVIVRPGDQDAAEGPGYFSGPIPWSSGAITSDSDLVGPYGQPVWTTQRPFATTRAYVLPPGTAQFEQWVRPTYNPGEKPEYRMLEEIAMGLGGGFQLDIYERWNIEPNDQDDEVANHEGVQIELRYALADWGDIILNPTLYAEWIERGGSQDKADKYELKLLLSDELGSNFYYASNFILEQEVQGEKETELGWSNAFGTTLIERCLMAGVEMYWYGTTVHGARNDPEVAFIIGPSIQWRPTNRTFVDLVGLFGTTSASPDAQVYLIFGYQFGFRAGPAEDYISGPASTRGN